MIRNHLSANARFLSCGMSNCPAKGLTVNGKNEAVFVRNMSIPRTKCCIKRHWYEKGSYLGPKIANNQSAESPLGWNKAARDSHRGPLAILT